jgi:hypothetical protein
MIAEQRTMLESAARARCLSVLDLTDTYHQIQVKPTSETYNTINTPFGCLQDTSYAARRCKRPRNNDVKHDKDIWRYDQHLYLGLLG